MATPSEGGMGDSGMGAGGQESFEPATGHQAGEMPRWDKGCLGASRDLLKWH
jgi:hypothetical protein